MSTLAQPRCTPEQYLAMERQAAHRSEYVNGRVYALAGASHRHNVIVGNTFGELRSRLRGRPCVTYVNDMRVKVIETGLYTYPDVAALCGDPQFEDGHTDNLLNPSVIVEVLSDSTERYDRGEKFAHYRRLESLREYVLVSQHRMRVELFVRQGEHWVLTELDGPDAVLPLESVGCSIPLGSIYEQVEFTEGDGARPEE